MKHTIQTHPNVGLPLSWASEGQKVWAPYTDGQFTLCVVTCAAGNSVRVKNEKRDFERWREVQDCFAFKDTEH